MEKKNDLNCVLMEGKIKGNVNFVAKKDEISYCIFNVENENKQDNLPFAQKSMFTVIAFESLADACKANLRNDQPVRLTGVLRANFFESEKGKSNVTFIMAQHVEIQKTK